MGQRESVCTIVEVEMRKKREVPSAEDRSERQRHDAERRVAEAAEAETALEEKIRRNIELYGA